MDLRSVFIFVSLITLIFPMIESSEKISLIAGGAGFLGSHMSDHLISKGHRIICLDNLSTGSKENISHLITHPKFCFIEHDITNPLPYIEQVDEVYNFACPASPPLYQKDPIHTLKTNVVGTLHLLELATHHRAKFFQASTSEVYGDPEMHPQKENYWGHVNPIGIRSCYDEGKRAAETLCLDFQRIHKTPIRIARIFNTYGPRMSPNDGRVVSNFIVQALLNQPITIYGKGDQTRSFCYVSDLIKGIDALMQSPFDLLGPVNLGNPAELTIKEIALEILQVCQSSSSLIYYQLPEDDPKKRKPDISFAKETLEWRPTVSLNEGLKLTAEYFQKVLSQSN